VPHPESKMKTTNNRAFNLTFLLNTIADALHYL